MAHRSSGGKSQGFRAPMRNPPKKATPAPPPAPARSGNGSFLGSLGATIADGMAFGGGSAMAHRAVDAIMGPRVVKHETAASPATAAIPAPTMNSLGDSDACGSQSRAFQDCLNSSGTEINKCQFYMDMLSECRKNSSSVIGA